MKRSPKATQSQRAERVAAVFTLLLEGSSRPEILQHIAKNWGVSARSADYYIAAAKAELEGQRKAQQQEALGLAIARVEDLWRRANLQYETANDRSRPRILGELLSILRSQAELLGLYPQARPEPPPVEGRESDFDHFTPGELVEFSEMCRKFKEKVARRVAQEKANPPQARLPN